MATFGEKKDLNMLLRNEWEFYDSLKMKKMKSSILVALLAFLWVVFFMVSYFINTGFSSSSGSEALTDSIIEGTFFTILFIVIVVVMLRKMDMEKGNWWFSCIQQPSLTNEICIQMANDFLKEQGVYYTPEETKRTGTLFITMFDLGGKDFKMRVWYSTILQPPVFEVGFGPQNDLNKRTIDDLKNEFSKMVAARYGPQSIPTPPIDTTTIP